MSPGDPESFARFNKLFAEIERWMTDDTDNAETEGYDDDTAAGTPPR